MTTTPSATVKFILNGKLVEVEDADLLAPLATTIRDRIGLKGTKVACGQGNCGACSVMIQYPLSNHHQEVASHPPPPKVVNSCLFPTGNLLLPHNGIVSIMTVEGAHKMDDVGTMIAECNGTQCGFCTPGMVVKATAYALDPGRSSNIEDIEDLLDGNLCRCTGYRPILYALKRRFGEHTSDNNDGVMMPVDNRLVEEMNETPPCVVRGEGGSYGDYNCSYSSGQLKSKNVYFPSSAAVNSACPDREGNRVPSNMLSDGICCHDPSTDHTDISGTMMQSCEASNEVPTPTTNADIAKGSKGIWHTPSSIEEVLKVLNEHPKARLVAGNVDSYRTPLNALPEETIFVSVGHIHQFTISLHDNNKIMIPHHTTIFEFLQFFEDLNTDKKKSKNTMFDTCSIVSHIKSIANIQVRNNATVAGNLIAAHKDKLPSDIALILSSMRGSIWLKAPGGSAGEEDELEVTVEEFVMMKPSDFPDAFQGVWFCTKLTAEVPVKDKDYVHLSRLSPRTNFPAICSISRSSYKDYDDGDDIIRVIGLESPLRIFKVPGGGSISPVAALQSIACDIASSSISAEHERVIIHMCARVFGIDNGVDSDSGGSQVMAVSQLAHRRSQGQRGEQRFFVDPAQAPVTEPLIKDAAYEHISGKAMYPIDVLPPVGTLNGSPVTMPTAVAEFDPWLLKEAAMNLLSPFNTKVMVLTAADLPFDKEEDFVIDNIYSDKHSQMFTKRNVMVDDSRHGAKEGVVPEVPTGKLGPGGFGEFVIAPGFTTYAGQVIALVLHPDETTSHKLALRMQKVLEDFFTPGNETWGVNKLMPDPMIKNLTPTHAIRNIHESKQHKKMLVGDNVPTVHAHGDKSMFDVDSDPQKGEDRYEEMWRAHQENPNVTYVESTEPIIAGRQTHLYLETQNATVRREEDRFYVTSSTQAPRILQEALSNMLNVAPRDVVVSFHRIGGGFGGKTYGSLQPALLASFATLVTGRPARVALDRRVDMDMGGKRHQIQGNYRVAVDQKTRQIIAMELTYDGDAGCSSEATMFVLQRAAITSSNVYRVAEFRCQANCWLTHKQSGTAFRSYGVIQAITITESAIDHAHAQLQCDLGVLVDAPAWRRANFYDKVQELPKNAHPSQWTDSTQYPVPPYYPRLPRTLSYKKIGNEYKPIAFDRYGQELFETANMCDPYKGGWAQATTHNPNFRKAKEECKVFNSNNKFKKRAVAVTPLLYGAGFGSWVMMQAAASVAISWAPTSWANTSRLGGGSGAVPKKNKKWQYAKLGYVLVNQGGCEMGQGVHIAVVQGVSAALNVPIGLVRIGKVNTDGTPNIVTTEASTGSDINVSAAVKAAKQLRHSLEKMEDGLIYTEALQRGLLMRAIWDSTKERFISSRCNHRNAHHEWYGLQKSFEAEPFPSGSLSETEHINHYIKYFRSWHIPVNERSECLPSFYIWEQVVNLAHMKRVPLFIGTMDGTDADGGRPNDNENMFSYQTYACAWSQVEVDGMTGEIDVLRTDIFYDAGLSRNPAVDIGQIEGAFVQGLGNLTIEECEYDFDSGLKAKGLIKASEKIKEHETGRLIQSSIMKYAVPEHRTVPRVLATHLTWIYDGPTSDNNNSGHNKSVPQSKFEQAQPPPGNVTDYRRAKTTGEPPLVLAVSVLSATREAVRLLKQSLLDESVTFVPMSTPLTPMNVLNIIWGEKNVVHSLCS